MKKLLVGVSALAMIGFAGSAMAQQIDNQNYNVNVNIEVAEEVSLWANDENIALVLDGADANNFKADESGINYINNVDAKIDVTVSGDLPTPSVPGGGVIFYIFDGVTAAQAAVNTLANAYAPAGALVWSDGTEGTSQEFDDSVGVNTSAVSNRLVTYAAATPGELPLPQNFDLDVLWTISALP